MIVTLLQAIMSNVFFSILEFTVPAEDLVKTAISNESGDLSSSSC